MGPKKVGANKGVWRRRSWVAPQSCGCPRARMALVGAKFSAARARWGQQQQVYTVKSALVKAELFFRLSGRLFISY